MRERLLPKPSIAVYAESINRQLHRLMGLPGEPRDYAGTESDAFWLVDQLVMHGWRINFWQSRGVVTAECVADQTKDGVPLAWVPQTKLTRSEAIAAAILDSLSRVRIGDVQNQGVIAPCPVCKGQGVITLHPAQEELIKILRMYGPKNSRQLHERDPSRTATAYTNALERLRKRGVVDRNRIGRHWVYHAL